MPNISVNCVLRIILFAGLTALSAHSVQAQRGGRGGGGGFDPSGFLSRLDRNGNGMLDPDEQEGRMGDMVKRMQAVDPSIKPGQPIPLSKVSEAFSKMRSQGSSGGRSSWGSRGGDERSGDRGRRDDRNRDDDRSNENIDPTAVEPLVPGFGVEIPVLPMLGFGPTAEIMAVLPNDADLEEARKNLQRYDRNRDGQLDADEIRRGGFWGNPMDFDRNGDGKLSERELATREAVERTAKASQRADRHSASKPEEAKSSDTKIVDFHDRRSYRVYAATPAEGLPRFFTQRDLNGDGQVSMSEYTSEWTDALVAEFYSWDANHDGVITAEEVMKGVNSGLTASDTSSGIAPQRGGAVTMTNATATQDPSSPSSSSSSSSSPSSPAGESRADSSTENPAMPSEPPSAKTLTMAKKIVERYDENGDLALSASEWGKMLISPAGADYNGDGRITVQEYAAFLTAKSQRLK